MKRLLLSTLSRKPHFWQSCLIAIVLLAGVSVLWYTQYCSVADEHERKLKLKAEYALELGKKEIDLSFNTLENLKNRVEKSGGSHLNYWESDAQLILQQNINYQYIEWLDTALSVFRVTSDRASRHIYYSDYNNVKFTWEVWLKHRNHQKAMMKYLTRDSIRGYTFLIAVPVHLSDKYIGGFTAGLNFQQRFKELLSYGDQYHIEFIDNGGNTFFTNSDKPWNSSASLSMTVPFKADVPISGEWMLRIQPNNQGFTTQNELIIHGGGVIGMMLSLTLAVLWFFWVQSRIDKKRVSQVNHHLTELNNDLKESWKMAQKASDVKSSFMSRMSHEMRTPLNGILGTVSIIEDQISNAVTEKYLKIIEKSTEELSALVDRMLYLNKLDSGDEELHDNRFVPIRLIESTLKPFEEKAQESNISLRLAPGRQSYHVMGDDDKLKEVITTLLHNAFKFTPAGGYIDVAQKEELKGDTVNFVLSVKDSGIGIPDEHKDRVFDKFEQGEQGANRMFEGAGLGLYICRKMLLLMGGSISVVDNPTGGTEFIVKVPFKAAKFSQNKPFESPEPRDRIEKVLIVEDNKINVMVLRKLLSTLGVESAVASNGQEALKEAGKADYDLIFMDMHMPVMDGYEATMELRKREVKIPILALSADVTPKSTKKAMAAGVNDYLSKPVTKSRLEEVLTQYSIQPSESPSFKPSPDTSEESVS